MTGWTRHEGIALALDEANVDTDQLIPARFMSRPRSEGYGAFLLHDRRRGEDGAPNAHSLNAHAPSVLVTGRNFGSGSSREAAVYALVDFGIRAVLAPSFGDIFAGNAVNNGLLPGRLDEAGHAALTAALADGPAPAVIDLEAGEARIGEAVAAFELDPVWRTKLANGWDDIDLTARHADAIEAFARSRKRLAPWAWPAQA